MKNILSKKLHYYFMGLITISYLLILIISIYDYLYLPSVKFSYTTGNCVEVLNYKKEDIYNCLNIPKIYHHIYVE